MVDATSPPRFGDDCCCTHRRAVHRVLLAEDDPDMRAMLAHALRRAGYHVSESEGGDAALAALTDRAWFRWPPDVVLSDVRMPGCDGLTLVEEMLRADLHIPTLLMTAFGDPALHEQAARLGVVRVLDKPFAVVDLLEVLEELIDRR